MGRYAQTMEHEPSRFVTGVKHPVQLMRAHAFLTRRHQPRCENPFRQRDVRTLHNGSDRHAKRLPAILAVVDASAKALRSPNTPQRGQTEPCGHISAVGLSDERDISESFLSSLQLAIGVFGPAPGYRAHNTSTAIPVRHHEPQATEW